MLGPIDYIVVGFKGNNFNGSVLKELQKASDDGIIRVVDLLFIIKHTDGSVELAEIEDQHEELKEVAKLIGHKGDMPLFTEADVEKIGNMMEADTSAGLLVIEHLWAKGLKKALIDLDGVLLDEGRIHPDKVEEAVKELETVK